MSDNPSNFNATGFNRSIRRRVELQGGNMRQLAQMATGDLYREEGVYPLIQGGGLPSKITTRAPTTPNSEADFTNRRVTRADYHDATISMDRQDLDRIVSDPRSEKTDVLLQKFKRLEDIVYQQAALGIAQGGDLGQTNAVFDTNNIIDVATGAASGKITAGFNYAKQKATIKMFGENLVNLMDGNMPCFVMAWSQWDDMMDDDKYINRDYNSTRLPSGGLYVPDYMGCRFIITEQVPYMATGGAAFQIADTDYDANGQWADADNLDIRAVIATTKDATLLEIKPDIMTRVGENPSLSYRNQVYMEMGLGAVRLEEEKVIVLPCDQSVA